MKVKRLLLDIGAATGGVQNAIVDYSVCDEGHLVHTWNVEYGEKAFLGYNPRGLISESEEEILFIDAELWSSTGTHQYQLNQEMEIPSFSEKGFEAIRASRAPYQPKVWMLLRPWQVFLIPTGTVLEEELKEEINWVFSQTCASRTLIVAGEPIQLESSSSACSQCTVEAALNPSNLEDSETQGNLTIQRLKKPLSNTVYNERASQTGQIYNHVLFLTDEEVIFGHPQRLCVTRWFCSQKVTVFCFEQKIMKK